MSSNLNNINIVFTIVTLELEKDGETVVSQFCKKCIDWIKYKANGDSEGAKKCVHSNKECTLPHYYPSDYNGKNLCGFILNSKPCPNGDECKMLHAKNYPKITKKEIKSIPDACFQHVHHILHSKEPCRFGEKCRSNHNLTELALKHKYCVFFLMGSCSKECGKPHYSKEEILEKAKSIKPHKKVTESEINIDQDKSDVPVSVEKIKSSNTWADKLRSNINK
jgi:superfamily I DNA and RNA helicase